MLTIANVDNLLHQGHIKAMLKFAKLLHCKGLHITFVNTEFNHKRILRSGGPVALDNLPGFHFETILFVPP
jgi:glycerol-3-phosphate cytidylyltransferase-like family protein